MILNTGNRTDIPAFYSNWFYNRIRAGIVLVRNPYYPQQVIEAFKRLSDAVGIQSVSWRYDSIFVSEKYSLDFHRDSFEKIASSLKDYANHDMEPVRHNMGNHDPKSPF